MTKCGMVSTVIEMRVGLETERSMEEVEHCRVVLPHLPKIVTAWSVWHPPLHGKATDVATCILEQSKEGLSEAALAVTVNFKRFFAQFVEKI